MEKIRSIKIISLLMMFIFAFFIFTNKNSATEITVKNETIRTFSNESSFVGVNWMDDNPDSRYIYQDTTLDKLAKTLHSINVNSIRYPSGVYVGNFFWDVPYKDVFEALAKPLYGNKPSPYLKYYTPADKLDFYRFMDFCKKNSIKATIQVNTHKYYDKNDKTIHFLKDYKLDEKNNRIWSTGVLNLERVKKSAEYAAKQVKWVKDNGYSNTIQYWELGNEDYAQSIYSSYYTGNEYAKVASIFIKEIKKADPNAKILLTNYICPDKTFPKDYYILSKWHLNLYKSKDIQDIKNQIFAITNHLYTFPDTDPQNDSVSYKNSIYNNSSLDFTEKFRSHIKFLSLYGFPYDKIVMNEFNASNFQSKFSHSWLGALANSKLIMSSANSPYCNHVDIHNMLSFYASSENIYKNKGFGVIHYAKALNEPFLLHPTANAIGLLNENLNGNVLKTDFIDNQIYAITSKDGDFIKVIILNFKEDRQITLNFSGFNSTIKYISNKSLGKDVPELFSIIDEGDSFSNPSEIRQLNILDNQIKVEKELNNYKFNLTKNTLSVILFKR